MTGLIDGEGTIALTRLHRGQNRQLVISISSTERSLLEWVLRSIRVGKITSKRVTSPWHAPGITYAVASRQAERARLVLEHYVRLTPRNGKYGQSLRAARLDFETRFAAISIRRCRSDQGSRVREVDQPFAAWSATACN